MAFVDERVVDILASGQTETPVVIVCEDDCSSIIDALAAEGTEIDKGAVDLGILRAVVDQAKLAALKDIKGVVAIEPDEEVQAQ